MSTAQEGFWNKRNHWRVWNLFSETFAAYVRIRFSELCYFKLLIGSPCAAISSFDLKMNPNLRHLYIHTITMSPEIDAAFNLACTLLSPLDGHPNVISTVTVGFYPPASHNIKRQEKDVSVLSTMEGIDKLLSNELHFQSLTKVSILFHKAYGDITSFSEDSVESPSSSVRQWILDALPRLSNRGILRIQWGSHLDRCFGVRRLLLST